MSITLLAACAARPVAPPQAPAPLVPSVDAAAKSSPPGPTAAPAESPAPLPPSDEPEVASTAPEVSLATRLEAVVGGSIVRSASSSAGARSRSIPRLVRKPPTVGPSYPPDLIKMVMRRSAPGFAKCVEGAPSSGPRRTLRFTIDIEGRAQDLSWGLASDAAKLSAGQVCVLDVIRGMKFVPPRSPIHVSYP